MANKKYTEFASGSAYTDNIVLIAHPITGALRRVTIAQLLAASGTEPGGGGGDTTPPTITARVVANSTPTQINLTFSESVTATTAGFSAKKNGSAWSISSISGSGTSWTLTMGSAAAFGDTLQLSYNSATGNTLDTAANELASFTDVSVTNNVGGALEDLVFGTGNGLSVSGTTWDGSNSGGGYDNFGVATKTIPASTDGYIRARYTAANGENAIIGIDTDSTIESWDATPSSPATPYNYKAFAWIYSGQIWYGEESVAVANTGVSISTGNYWRISRVGSTWKVQKSTDGTSWTDAVTLAYTGTGQIYLKAAIDHITDPTAKLYEPKGFNVS
jgi:hypothetical protein